MRRGYGATAQKFAVDVRLVLPAVNGQRTGESGILGGDQSRGIDNLSAGTVYDYRRPAQLRQKSRVDNMKSGIVAFMRQRSMEGDYVGFESNAVKRNPVIAAFGSLPRRVATKHTHIKAARPTFDDSAHMANAYDTDSLTGQRTIAQLHQCAEHILRHRRGIASGSIDSRNAA